MILRRAIQFTRHWLGASTRYSTHSPFVYDFVTKVLPHRLTDEGTRIDQLRSEALRSKKLLSIDDHGAGYDGVKQVQIQKTLGDVARSSARGRRSGELLLRLMQHYQPQESLELGTNLGFSALYQLSGSPETNFTTVEGAKQLADHANLLIREQGKRATVLNQTFEETITTFLQDQRKFDHIILDGHHEEEATITYARDLISLANPGACLIIDDINWSAGMEKAWMQIKSWPEVTISIDLYSMGLCFLNRPQAKEEFRFRFLG